MRTFEIINADEQKRGEGVVFWDGTVATREHGSDGAQYSDNWASVAQLEGHVQQNGFSLVWLDSPAAHASDGIPVDTLDNPPPREEADGMPSERTTWMRESAMRVVAAVNASPRSLLVRASDIVPVLAAMWEALEDERLGRAPSKETR